jgi:hypothetical protein
LNSSTTTPLTLAGLIDYAIASGAKFTTDSDWARVYCDLPSGFPSEALLELQENAPGMRLLVKLRCLGTWLAEEHEQWLRGESLIGGKQYGDWVDVFVGSDRLLRSLYDFTSCIWGSRTCNEVAPVGYAPVLCEACGDRKEE